MKNNLPYFSHDNNAHRHPKMKALRAQFGASGYGNFWILNEMISDSANAQLDLSRKVNKGAVAEELRMTYEELDNFLSFLSDPEIDLVNYSDGILTTDRTSEDYAEVRGKRERDKARIGPKKAIVSENSNIASEKPEIASEKHREQSRAEQRREEQQPGARALKAAEEEPDEATLLAFALEEARARRDVVRPEGFARKILAEERPRLIADLLASRRPGSAPIPPPPHCACGGSIIQPMTDRGRCSSCGALWEFDPGFQVWRQDEKAG